MATFPLIVAIATRERARLLERTLGSLSDCERPPDFLKVVVVENGGGQEMKSIVEDFAFRLPLVYAAVGEAGKCGALNWVISAFPEAFIVFTDDDVRFDRMWLMAYSLAANLSGPGTFFGGRCQVDWEEAPVDWIVPFLPPSARGWSLGDEGCAITEALGFNWGAFASDILTAGSFPVERGPGMPHSIGDETEMQERLAKSGISGKYLPDALVWHFVPKERCSEEWAIDRAYQQGIARGLRLHAVANGERRQLLRRLRFNAGVLAAISTTANVLLDRRSRFILQRKLRTKLGVVAGLKRLEEIAQCLSVPSNE